ncbi:MFS transporter [Dyella sp. LX-66]|uniref:MFS transporter n=1 Tax=unclassified Dyella TaxID=2634549 RepID=UPI001BE0D4BD|nr:MULTISPECIES: MFS transporter [unclassified Dyella]MBT2117615.1 MFS transporter [Dyella sp. LX-1]MBT2141381.1 MFS transporter [Dyella sp. LX-66]
MSAADKALPYQACEPAPARLPMLGLLALACASFITVLTECIVAGLLPAMSRDLGLSAAAVGQLTTVYALGSLLTAVPMVKLTSHLPRRPLLMAAILGFALVNSAMAWTVSYTLMLVSRFLGGVAAGLLWALLAGYASRMVAPQLQGRAIAVAMVGTPLAMSIGIPAGTWLSQLIGWRWVFGLMSILSVLLVGWSRAALPPVPGVPPQHGGSLRDVLGRPGLLAVYVVMLLAVLAHNVLYTYIAPFVALSGSQDALDRLLLLFGVSSVVSIAVTGALIDRWMRALMALGMALFLLASVAMALWPSSQGVLVGAVAVWGLGFGGAATLIQTAVARRSGEQQDLGQSLVVVGWNLAIAGGGVVGGVMLKSASAALLPWALVVLLVLTLWVAVPAKKAWA